MPANTPQERPSGLERAMASFQEARSLVDKESDPALYAVLSSDIGNVHQAAGRLGDAAEEYRESADCMGLAGNPQQQAAVLLLLGQMRRKLDELDKALEAALDAQSLLRSMPEPPAHDLAQALVLAGDVLRVNQPAEALPHLQEARQLLAMDGVGTPLEQVAVLERTREAYLALNATADAQAALDDRTEILTRHTAEVLSGNDVAAVLELANVLVDHEQLTQARSALERAEVLLDAETGGTPAQRARLSHDLGRTYEALGNQGQDWAYAGARAAYQNTLKLIDPGNDPSYYEVVLYDLADVHKAEGNWDEAADAYQKSAKHAGVAGNHKRQIQALRQAGQMHLRFGVLRSNELPDSDAEADD